MQLISKSNKGNCVLLCVVDIYNKYESVVPLKDKNGITIIKAFQKILKESNRKPNKIRVDKGREFYNSLIKSSLEKNSKVQFQIHKFKFTSYKFNFTNYEFKSKSFDFTFLITSSNLRVTSLNLRVTNSNPQVASSNQLVQDSLINEN